MMEQEIRINVSFTLCADVDKNREDIIQFVGTLIPEHFERDGISLMGHRVLRVMEEAEIYNALGETGCGVWEFVEAHYPNYHGSDEIAENEDLCKIVHGELTGDAAVRFERNYGRDMGRVLADYERSCREVYHRAIMGYLESERETIAIRWGVKDIEERARQNGYLLKAGEAMKVLELLKERHDANLGITWDTIDAYLSYIVPDSVEDDGFLWEAVQFKGSEYLCRLIADLANPGGELLVAPMALMEQMLLHTGSAHKGEAVRLDERIAYYACEEEMQLSDAAMYQLVCT